MRAHRFGMAAALFLALGLFSGSAHAALTRSNFRLRTGADLVAVCSAQRGQPLATAAVNFCHGFVIGVFRTLLDEQAATGRKLFCFKPVKETFNEALAKFVAWADTRPEVLRGKPEDAIFQYLTVRFPCDAHG